MWLRLKDDFFNSVPFSMERLKGQNRPVKNKSVERQERGLTDNFGLILIYPEGEILGLGFATSFAESVSHYSQG